MSELVWKDPPPPENNRGRVKAIVEELKMHPGQWAFIGVYKGPASITDLKRRYGLEATSRRNAENTYDIYARWPEDAA